MPIQQNINIQEENDLKKIIGLLLRNKIIFVVSLILSLSMAFLINRYLIPVYQISSSILIKEDNKPAGGGAINDYLNSNLFGKNQNFQNELWVLKSPPIIEKTIKNLNLLVDYSRKEGFQYIDVYKESPFRIMYSPTHVQPLNVRFNISFFKGGNFKIEAKSDEVYFYNYNTQKNEYSKRDWAFQQNGKLGRLVENADMAFIVQWDSTKQLINTGKSEYCFKFQDFASLTDYYCKNFQFNVVDKKATVIEISLTSQSVEKGIDMVNGIMDVYSNENLERKNYLASRTIDYIEKQLGEISDSLSTTENNLQRFRSANQLLNVTEQATGISAQYVDLQNQRAELMTRKRYYDYVSDYLSKNEDFSDMMVPASIGIPDPILTSLMTELIAAQAQRSNLIENKQEKNPLVNRLNIKIENIKKTIVDNISAVRQTIDISLDEMNKRVSKIEAQISNLPKTQQQLGGFERKYRLNDAIYNYLQEKRAEAKITKASNLPDDLIIGPAQQIGVNPIQPNKLKNYLIAVLLGLGLPFVFLFIKKMINSKVETIEDIERITNVPILGKILHNYKKTNNVVFEFPKSPIAESYRVLRTNLDFSMKGSQSRVIMVSSCIEGEGKSFNALNIAMSYAQLGRRTLLIDFDLRKPTPYFNKPEEFKEGLSSFLNGKSSLKDIIIKSPESILLEYICSGPIPPNPAELLAFDKTRQLINNLKENYDYIILDTPPLAQVTDGFLLLDIADTKIIVVRYKYSKKDILKLIMRDLKQKNVENVCIVLNDNKIKRDQYGYGYGYNKK